MVGQLTELSFDLQVQICKFLQPPQILALRQTSKAFHQVTSQRIVWIHALMRICHENSLFLPTFSIDDMSVAELERAANAPFRWIAFSSSTARNDNDLIELPISRTIKTPRKDQREYRYLRRMYLVPGGRYLVVSGEHFLGVWDLESVSDGEDGRSIGIWEDMDERWRYIDFIVHPTPDGQGIRILATSSQLSVTYTFYVFEIYPLQETPGLVKIAEFTINQVWSSFTYSLNGNRVVIYETMKGTFTVWDFVAETVANWSSTIRNNGELYQVIRVTETVIIIHDTRGHLLIFEIPPLKPKTIPFDNEDLPIVTPMLSYVTHVDENAWFQKPDSWYSGDLNSLPLCVDILHQDQRRRCKLDTTCDFSTVRLVPISTERRTSYEILGEYRICHDKFVNVMWGIFSITVDVCGGFGRNGNNSLSQIRDMSFTFPLEHSDSSFCPVSARFAFIVENDIVISDFLKD